MCLIIIKQRDIEVPQEVLKNASRINPHGLGVVWLDTFEVTYHKSKNWAILNCNRPYIAHFRYATVGVVSIDNTHPFRCGIQKNEYLMMNGTIAGLGNSQKCDSKILAESLGSVPRHKWKKELQKHKLVRFVTINTRVRTFQIYNRDLWTFRGGVWYSKDNVFQDNLVAVYGTLKRGYSNYHRNLTSSKYVGSGTTKDKYPLLVKGLPYLIDECGKGHKVKVDVFKVTDSVMRDLDQLEGHPDWYRRKKVPIVLNKKTTVSCWVYFNITTNRYYNDVMHESYEVTYFKPKQYKVIDTTTPTWEPSYRQLKIGWLDDLETEEEVVDSFYCTSCYSDLEHDGYVGYCCMGCNEWYTEQEVRSLI